MSKRVPRVLALTLSIVALGVGVRLMSANPVVSAAVSCTSCWSYDIDTSNIPAGVTWAGSDDDDSNGTCHIDAGECKRKDKDCKWWGKFGATNGGTGPLWLDEPGGGRLSIPDDSSEHSITYSQANGWIVECRAGSSAAQRVFKFWNQATGGTEQGSVDAECGPCQ